MRGHRPLSCVVLGLLLVFGATSCGTLAYDRAWDSHVTDDPQDPMQGRWRGRWSSEWNGHSGGLRCLMTREEEGRYLARFHSTYGWLLSFRHETIFVVTGEEQGALRFEGSEDLGSLVGGVYTYAGRVAGDDFEATYSAENGDHGVFTLTRVPDAQE